MGREFWLNMGEDGILGLKRLKFEPGVEAASESNDMLGDPDREASFGLPRETAARAVSSHIDCGCDCAEPRADVLPDWSTGLSV